ncbi:unnamed protein product [Clonostachys byssicola]|uniref:Uncharacterized protein n=1 Tax=Clonostachys byssicola TaxID=160290 RepID=A0A9N9Y648_9HYPO|nr:unnamed protein product [Clonostachys byssicola]
MFTLPNSTFLHNSFSASNESLPDSASNESLPDSASNEPLPATRDLPASSPVSASNQALPQPICQQPVLRQQRRNRRRNPPLYADGGHCGRFKQYTSVWDDYSHVFSGAREMRRRDRAHGAEQGALLPLYHAAPSVPAGAVPAASSTRRRQVASEGHEEV